MQVENETWAAKGTVRTYWPVVLAGILGTAMSVSLFITAHTWEKRQARAEFCREAQERVAAFERELIYCLAGLEQFGGFFAGSEEVTRAEFREYANRLGHGYIHDWTIKWVPRVLKADRAGFEESVRNEGIAGFTIRQADAGGLVPASEREAYFPVRFVEPVKGRRDVLGVDLGSIAGVLDAFTRSMDSGEIVVSPYQRLLVDPDGGTDTLAVVPVYRAGTSIESQEDRRRNLDGFIVGTFILKSVLERTGGSLPRDGVAVAIQDPLSKEDPLIVWAPGLKPGLQVDLRLPAVLADANALYYQTPINVGDRYWRITWVALPGYRHASGSWSEWMLLTLGLLLTVMIMIYLRGSAIHAQGLLAVNKRLKEEVQHCQRVEAELARHQSHLEDLVAERTRQLAESQATLAQTERLASVGTLAAGIAHEINNPLGTMMLAAENALELREKPGSEAMVENCLSRIVAEARRCGDVIRSVLQFTRQEQTQKWPSALDDIVKRSLDMTDAYARKHGAVVSMELPSELPLFLANPLQMEQVFTNLIRNAIETGRKGVRVVVRAEVAGASMRITVEDNGPGIPEEHLPRVFDPFFTTRREEGGTGLGLSIVHGIIAEHGGTISVQSRVGAGTLFVIDLPVTASAGSEVSDGQTADR